LCGVEQAHAAEGRHLAGARLGIVCPNAMLDGLVDGVERPAPQPGIVAQIGIAERALRAAAVTGRAIVAERGLAAGKREAQQFRIAIDRLEIAGGGLFVDLASHTLDFLDFVLGPVSRVCGFTRNQAGAYPAEDMVSAAFEFKNGVQAVGTWCFSSFESADRVTFVGSDGKVTLSTFGTEPVQLETPTGTEVFDLPNPPHIQQPLIQQVVNELLGVGSCVSTGESALRTNWVMDQLLMERTSS